MLKEHEITIRVRYSETDAMGYLHHANFPIYYEMGRTEMLRAQGGDYRQMEEEGLFMVVVRLNLHYRQPARFDDLLTLRTKIKNVGGAKLEHTYELYRDGVLLANAESTLACVDREGKILPIPDRLREM